MITWKPLVGEYLQYMEEPTNEMDKKAIAMVCTNLNCI